MRAIVWAMVLTASTAWAVTCWRDETSVPKVCGGPCPVGHYCDMASCVCVSATTTAPRTTTTTLWATTTTLPEEEPGP